MGESWLSWFLSQREAALFVEIDRDFLVSESMRPEIQEDIDNIETARSEMLGEHTTDGMESEPVKLYGLIHARYLSTENGMQRMIEKRKQGKLPKCPRMLCNNCACVPVAVDGDSRVKMFCPNCTDVYECKEYDLDGKYFGKEWVHLLMKQHPEIVEGKKAEAYEPLVYGFKVYMKPKK